MTTSPRQPRILLSAPQPAALDDVHDILARAGHSVSRHEPGAGELPDHDLAVVDGGRGPEAALRPYQRARCRHAGEHPPVLFVTDDHGPVARLAALEAGADACLLRPFAPGELLAQVRALLRSREVNDRLAEKTTELHHVNRRLRQALAQMEQQVELARRLQQNLLPQTLPELPQVRFAVFHLSSGRVGGDFYDVFRLDEGHVGLYVADAVGHDVPSSLLSIFVKKGVRPKEITGRTYRLVPPGEVLGRLNRDLLEQRLAEMPFVMMVYALLNHRDGTLRFARAGYPYPLYVPRQGEVGLWPVEGSLLGVFDAAFPVREQRLQPGDKVLFYSDGFTSDGGEEPGPADALVAGAARLRDLPLREFVQRLGREQVGQDGPADDLTLLGLEMGE